MVKLIFLSSSLLPFINPLAKLDVIEIWLDRSYPISIIDVKLKTIPGWKQKFNVVNYFYKDLYENY